MKYALVIPGGRIAQIEETVFDVAPPFMWVEVSYDVTPNTHYWDGEKAVLIPAPEPEPPTVPAVVSRAKGKVVLIRAGLWQSVLDYVAAIPDPEQRAIAEVALHDTQEWSRESPFMAAISSALGVTEEQMDQLFIATQEVVL